MDQFCNHNAYPPFVSQPHERDRLGLQVQCKIVGTLRKWGTIFKDVHWHSSYGKSIDDMIGLFSVLPPNAENGDLPSEHDYRRWPVRTGSSCVTPKYVQSLRHSIMET